MTRIAKRVRGMAFAIAVAGALIVQAASAQEVIELPGEDRWLGAGFEAVFRIGSLAGAEWEQFGNVRKVAFDGAGRLYVFDNQADRIFVVGTDGALIREMERRGEGPGEFRRATDFVALEDGRVVVADMDHRAYHLFDVDGDFERMVRMGGNPSYTAIGTHMPQRGTDALVTSMAGGTMSISFQSFAGPNSLNGRIRRRGPSSASTCPARRSSRTPSRRRGSPPVRIRCPESYKRPVAE